MDGRERLTTAWTQEVEQRMEQLPRRQSRGAITELPRGAGTAQPLFVQLKMWSVPYFTNIHP